MAEYLIQEETLTGIADKIRILNGTEGTMTTAQMDSKLGEANTEVANQTDLIEQIMAALNAKFGSGANLITFTIKLGETGGAVYEYQAEEGMTWGEWVSSEYCTGTKGYEIYIDSNNNICYNDEDEYYQYVVARHIDEGRYEFMTTEDVIDQTITDYMWYANGLI